MYKLKNHQISEFVQTEYIYSLLSQTLSLGQCPGKDFTKKKADNNNNNNQQKKENLQNSRLCCPG